MGCSVGKLRWRRPKRKIASCKVLFRFGGIKAALDKHEPAKGTSRLLPRTVLEALHEHIAALCWESASSGVDAGLSETGRQFYGKQQTPAWRVQPVISAAVAPLGAPSMMSSKGNKAFTPESGLPALDMDTSIGFCEHFFAKHELRQALHTERSTHRADL